MWYIESMNSAFSENLAGILFVLNMFLILLDASLGYYLAPHLLRHSEGADAELRESAIHTVRRMLTALVTLYMFFNCLGFFDGNSSLLMIVSALVVCDIVGQTYLKRRSKQNGEHS
jgi:hypothetical protein